MYSEVPSIWPPADYIMQSISLFRPIASKDLNIICLLSLQKFQSQQIKKFLLHEVFPGIFINLLAVTFKPESRSRT